MGLSYQRFEIPVVAPFSLHYTVRVLQRLPSNRIDRWEDGVYRRLLAVGERWETVAVHQSGAAEHPVVVGCARLYSSEVAETRSAIQRLLGATVDLGPFYRMVRAVAPLSSLATALTGLKPPRYLSLFEALVNAICCQQVSLTVGILMLNRLAEAAGHHRSERGDTYIAFPSTDQILRLKPEQMRGLGLSGSKAAALTALAEVFATGRLSQSEIEQLPTPEALERLQQLNGVGAWSARYALLRGLGRLDVFPSGDSGAARALGELLGQGPMSPEQTEAFARHWKQYAGLLYFHLLGNRYLPERQERLALSRVPVPLTLP